MKNKPGSSGMDSDFIKSLQDLALAKRARIGIGIWNADADLIASLQSAGKYADLLLVGEPGCDCAFDYVPAKEPWKELVRLLAEGEIEGAVRGNLPAGRTMRALAEQFDIRVKRLALLELSGWAFLLGPVGIDEGETAQDRLGLVLGGAKLLQEMGIAPKAAVLSGGRMEDLGTVRARGPQPRGGRAYRSAGAGGWPAGPAQRDTDRELPGRRYRHRSGWHQREPDLPDAIALMRRELFWCAGADGKNLCGLQPGEGL